MVFGEPDAELIAERLEGAILLASHLLDFELTSIAVKKWRRQVMSYAELHAAFATRAKIPVRLLAVDFEAVFNLAILTKLSAYDASYLWLAQHYQAELVTLDQKLRAAFLSDAGR